MLQDLLIIAVKNLTKRRLRSWLTIFGVLIGIIAIVALISIAYGLQESILSESQKAGTNRLIITPGGGSGATPITNEFTISKFYEDDLDVVKQSSGVTRATGMLVNNAKITYKGKAGFAPVFGTKTDASSTEYQASISFFKVDEGRQLRATDKYAAILGDVIASGTFNSDVRLGDKIEINGHDFTVVGIQRKSGNPGYDRSIRIPIEPSREIFNKSNELSNIFAETDPTIDTNAVAAHVKKDLRRARHVKEGEEDFTVKTSQQVLDSFKTILDIVTYIIAGIAGISLLVGSVGITNTMYTAVLERTREIGIMKAIGATRNQILMIFLVESGLLGLIGGVLGVSFGLLLGKLVEVLAASAGFGVLKLFISAPLIIGSLFFSFVIGSAAGFLPAWQASKLSAVDAIRK